MSVCVCVALVIQHAKLRRRNMTFVTPLALPYFSTLSHKRQDFRKNDIEYQMCVLTFSTTFI
jgi:hypothetical protein